MKKHKNQPLVETLDKIEKTSASKPKEQACYVTLKGKCLFCVGGQKNQVTPNDTQVKTIKKLNKDLIVTHNHPYPYNSSITGEDLQVVIGNNSAGVRAITKKYTYVAMRPKNGWGVSWSKAKQTYDSVYKTLKHQWNTDYQNRKITKSFYENNFTHEVMNEVSKKLKFVYFRFKN